MSARQDAPWSLAERSAELSEAARSGVDLLVIGGGITGAGVLRDAASRGARVLLVERDDFASGTSSRSSKMIHGGLRYIGEGQLGTTRESCRERDLLMRLDPNLVRPQHFLFPAYADGKVPLWQVRAALSVYAALANFRRTARHRMLKPAQVLEMIPALRGEGLRGAGIYTDGTVDDARLVLETLKSARSLSGAAVNHAEVVEILHGEGGAIRGARVRDRLSDEVHEVAAAVVVNAAGPSVERVRGLDRTVAPAELRPAKGVHLVLPRERIATEVTVTFEAADGRQVFLAPWDDVAIIGTTDDFTEEVEHPTVEIGEVHYLLDAANAAFPGAGLTTNDLRSVYAGVRPLAAGADDDAPSTSVSREHRITEDSSGLISACGGKLTTYRAMGEHIVDRVVRRLPDERRQALGPSLTPSLPLRGDDFESEEFERGLCERFGVSPRQSAHLSRTYGGEAWDLLETATEASRRPIGSARNTFAEIGWAFRRECAASLCDVLERRLGMAIFAVGQGLAELSEIAAVAAEAAGWDEARTREEALAYACVVRSRYQISPPKAAKSAA